MLQVGGDFDLVQEPVSPNCRHQFRTEHLDRDLPIGEGGFDAVESARDGLQLCGSGEPAASWPCQVSGSGWSFVFLIVD